MKDNIGNGALVIKKVGIYSRNILKYEKIKWCRKKEHVELNKIVWNTKCRGILKNEYPLLFLKVIVNGKAV